MATNSYGNGTSTASNGANTVVHYYDRAGIKAANAVSVYSQFLDKKSLPPKMGKTFKISKWQHIYDLDEGDANFAANGYLGRRDLASVTTNLANSGSAGTIAEGAGAVNQVTPTKVTVETDIARYGFMIEYTDEVVLFSEDPVQVKYREELGYLVNQAHEDLVQRDMLTGAGIVINAGTSGNIGTIGATITADDTNAENFKVSFDLIRKGVKALVRNRAKRNTSIVSGSTKIDTRAVNKAFYAIVGPEVKYDLEELQRGSGNAESFAYIPAYQYAAAGNLAEGEIGSMHDVRFIESEGALYEAAAGSAIPGSYAGSLSNDGANFDVFPVLFPTEGSFAALGLQGKGKVQFISKSPMEATDLANPYGTKGFFSANMWYAGLVLQPEKLLRINVLATA